MKTADVFITAVAILILLKRQRTRRTKIPPKTQAA